MPKVEKDVSHGNGTTSEHQDEVVEDKQSDVVESDEPLFEYSDLNERQLAAIEVLAVEPTYTKAAAILGVSERTLRRYMGLPEFRRALQATRRVKYQEVAALTQHWAKLAVETVIEVMTDKATPAATRLSAATHVLRAARAYVEHEDMALRMDGLDESLEQY